MLSAHVAVAATLAGTAHYGGSLGPVSATRPIGVLVSDTSDLGGNQQVVRIAVNNGKFSLSVPAGTYYLAVFLDSLNLGIPVVGEPYQLYNDRFMLPADPLTVPDSGVSGLALNFNDDHLLAGIFGTISYTGHLGQVSKNSRLEMFAYSDPDLTMWSGLESNSKSNGGPYEIVTLNMNSYYLLAFFDLNGNRMPDTGEPFEIYDGEGKPPGDAVMASPTQTGINFSFGDEHLLPVPTSGTATSTPNEHPTSTPTTTHAGTPLPTSTPGPCVGDCDNNHMVIVNELVECVNIALNIASLDTCSKCSSDGKTVTISDLVTAVNNAFNGCPGG